MPEELGLVVEDHLELDQDAWLTIAAVRGTEPGRLNDGEVRSDNG